VLFNILEKENNTSRDRKGFFNILEKEDHTLRNRKGFLISWKRKIKLCEIESAF
jgi:hypothetical protein